MTDVQKEFVFWTVFRQTLELVVKPELVGIAIRQAENWSDDIEARKAVGKLIDDIKALRGVEVMIENESAVAKVNFHQNTHFFFKKQIPLGTIITYISQNSL